MSFANAFGGASGQLGGLRSTAGGAALATSTATVTGPGGVATAFANAGGGIGATTGSANATAQANATLGGLASAQATAGGSTGQALAGASITGAGLVVAMSTSASAPVSGSMKTAADANSSFVEAVAHDVFDTWSFATALPGAFAINTSVAPSPTVGAALTAAPAQIAGIGSMGAFWSADNTGPTTSNSQSLWTLDTTASSGRLMLGLLGHDTLGGGFTNLRLVVSVGGVEVTNTAFATPSAANGFFLDNLLDLGAVPVLPSLSVSVSLVADMNATGSGFSFTYVLGVTNGGTDSVAPLPPALRMAPSYDTGRSQQDGLTSNPRPLIFGQAEAQSTITLFDGTTQIGTTAADAGGEWFMVPAGPLAPGTHSLTAKATDAAANTSVASAALVVTIDSAAPAAPSAPDLAAASDTGSSDTDNLTRLRTLNFTGMAEANAFVALVENGVVIEQVRADATGAWSATPVPRLAEGVHSITARAIDAAGNTSVDSAPLLVTVDLAATTPTTPDLLSASDTGKSAGDNVTAVTTPRFGGKADPGATILLMEGATQVGSGVTAASGTWNAQATGLADGPHVLTAVAIDKAGNVSATSAGLTVTIDTASPAQPPAMVLAAASDTGASATDGITRDTTPTLSGTAEAGATVSLFDGAALTPLATTTASAAGAWTITTAALAEGLHSFRITATDAAGNASPASLALPVTIDLSVATPAAPVLTAATDTGASSSDGITNDTTPDFTGTTEAFAAVTLLAGATVLGTGTANLLGVWTITSKALATGAHAVTVKVTDLAGNVSALSAAGAVTIDTGVPAAPSTPDLAAASDSGTSSTDNLTNVVTPDFSGKAEANATVTLFDGATTLASVKVSGAGTWSLTAPALAPGAHVITAKATDSAGNVSAASGAVTVTVDTAAPGVPGVPDMTAASDTGASNADNITRTTTPVFSGKADAGAIITLLEGAAVLGSVTANAQGAWSITSAVLGAGVHAITATAADKAGNASAPSAALTVTIDTAIAAPGTPDLAAASDKGVSDTDNLTNVATPGLTGKAEAGATVTLFSTLAGGAIGSGIADGTGTWTIKTQALGDGAHAITAKAVDVAGNASVASPVLTITIDTGVPPLPVIATLTPSAVAGAAEAGTTVTVTDGATALGSASVDPGGSWTLPVALAPGVHALAARAVDDAGNVSAATAAQVVTMGTAGEDVLATAGPDRAVGGAGDDFYLVDDAADLVIEFPGEGTDIVQASVGYTLPAASAIEFLVAAGGTGLALGGNERVNTLSGSTGGDTLTGGGGGDGLIGGAGVDTFRYTALADSQNTAGLLDTIFDFDEAAGERLDVSALDASAGLPGDQGFSFLGTSAFSGVAGQLRVDATGPNTLVLADVTGDSIADFAVQMNGSHTLGAGNFML